MIYLKQLFRRFTRFLAIVGRISQSLYWLIAFVLLLNNSDLLPHIPPAAVALAGQAIAFVHQLIR